MINKEYILDYGKYGERNMDFSVSNSKTNSNKINNHPMKESQLNEILTKNKLKKQERYDFMYEKGNKIELNDFPIYSAFVF